VPHAGDPQSTGALALDPPPGFRRAARAREGQWRGHQRSAEEVMGVVGVAHGPDGVPPVRGGAAGEGRAASLQRHGGGGGRTRLHAMCPLCSEEAAGAARSPMGRTRRRGFRPGRIDGRVPRGLAPRACALRRSRCRGGPCPVRRPALALPRRSGVVPAAPARLAPGDEALLRGAALGWGPRKQRSRPWPATPKTFREGSGFQPAGTADRAASGAHPRGAAWRACRGLVIGSEGGHSLRQ
jgi:hypothetical protein